MLIVAHYYSDPQARILFGNGDGTLTSGPVLAGASNYALAADLNNDGHLDIAVAHYSGLIDVFFGNGNGSFQAPYPLTAPGGIGSMAVGDFNADGLADLVAGDNSNSVNVWLGTGANSFDPARSFAVNTSNPQFGTSLVVGRFDADSAPDIAVISGSVDAVSVLINDGVWPPVGPPLPAVFISDASVTEGNSGTTTMSFTLTLSAPVSQAVSVQFSTADGTAVAGSDYFATGGTVTFAPGETSKSISVEVLGDLLGEPYETFSVSLHDPIGMVIADGTGIGTIIGDDFTLSLYDRSFGEDDSGTESFFWSVGLSAPSTQTVTVQFLTANGTATAGSDYQSTGGTLTFLPGETSKAFTLTLIGDRIPEANETFFVDLSNPTNATIPVTHYVGTILDNEPRVSINNVSTEEGRSGTKNFTFTVTLSAAYDQAVTMSFRTVNGTATSSGNKADYIAQTGTVTFNPGETSKTITILVKGDKRRESDETFSVELFNLSSNALFTDNLGLGTILNDD